MVAAVNDYFRDLYCDLAERWPTARPFLQSWPPENTPSWMRLNRETGTRLPLSRFTADVLLNDGVGRDISSLNTVYMRNVPPTPANSRSAVDVPGEVASPRWCSPTAEPSPHDQYFFADPKRMVAGADSTDLGLANQELLEATLRPWAGNDRKAATENGEGLVGSMLNKGRS